MKKVLMLILIIVGCSVSETKAQKVALKSNLLYDATATMNLGLEFGLARKWTLDIPMVNVYAIGEYNRKFDIGFVSVLTVPSWDCTDIMPNSM